METPPPYYPPSAPPKKNNTLLILVIVIAAICICCLGVVGLGVFGAVTAGRQVMPLAECAASFESMRESLTEYAEEHDGKLPPAEGWEDALRPYYKPKFDKMQREMGNSPIKMELMPVDGPWGCKLDEKTRSTMVYNLDVAGKELEKLGASTVLLYETPETTETAKPFKRQDQSNAPVIFGEKRPWLEMPVEGDMDIEMGSTSGSTSK
jgi:hypothetical protein